VAPLIIMLLLTVLLRSESRPPRAAIKVRGTSALFVTELEVQLENPEEESEAFELVDLPQGIDAQEAIRSGFADCVLVIPDHFLEERASGKRSELALLVEGADPMETQEIFSRFRKALPDSLTNMPVFLPEDCDAHCASTIPDGPPKLDLIRVHGNNIEDNMDFFTPVLPPFFVFFFVFLLSGMAFLRERTGGTAERVLASPLRRSELVGGYVVGFLPAALIQAAVVILFARFVIGGPWGGWVSVLAIILLTLVAECLGVFVSAFARTEFQVMQFIPIVILPQILLCGIIWPLSGFPDWLKVVAYCMPLTYAVDAIRDVALRDMSLGFVAHDILALLGFVLVGGLLAALSVHRSI